MMVKVFGPKHVAVWNKPEFAKVGVLCLAWIGTVDGHLSLVWRIRGVALLVARTNDRERLWRFKCGNTSIAISSYLDLATIYGATNTSV